MLQVSLPVQLGRFHVSYAARVARLQQDKIGREPLVLLDFDDLTHLERAPDTRVPVLMRRYLVNFQVVLREIVGSLLSILQEVKQHLNDQSWYQ